MARNAVLEAGKGKEIDSSLEAPEEMQSWWHPGFSPVDVILECQPQELWENKFTLYYLTNFGDLLQWS